MSITQKGKTYTSLDVSKLNTLFPKVAFPDGDVNKGILLKDASAISSLVGTNYVIVEPIVAGWGNTYDILSSSSGEESYILSYFSITTTVPVATE